MADKPKRPENPPKNAGIAGLDELALRLSVPPVDHPQGNFAIAGRSGRLYNLVQLLANVIEGLSSGIEYFVVMGAEAKQVHQEVKAMYIELTELRSELNELNKGVRLSKETDNTARDTTKS